MTALSTAPSSRAAASPDDAATAWAMLALISAGFLALTLNWFDVAAAFRLSGRSSTSDSDR